MIMVGTYYFAICPNTVLGCVGEVGRLCFAGNWCRLNSFDRALSMSRSLSARNLHFTSCHTAEMCWLPLLAGGCKCWRGRVAEANRKGWRSSWWPRAVSLSSNASTNTSSTHFNHVQLYFRSNIIKHSQTWSNFHHFHPSTGLKWLIGHASMRLPDIASLSDCDTFALEQSTDPRIGWMEGKEPCFFPHQIWTVPCTFSCFLVYS